MVHTPLLRTALFASAMLFGGTLQAQLHDEAVDGDLSSSAGAPTALVFSVGSNVIRGTVQASSDTRDYITFTLPGDVRLAQLVLNSYDDVASGGLGNTGYHALRSGATSVVPNMANGGTFLGGDHVRDFQIGSDILPNLAFALTNGTGFTAPLGPGTYTYHIQQTGTEETAYELEFIVEQVWTDEGCALPGVSGDPALVGSGSLAAGEPASVALSNAAPSAFSGIFVSLSSTPVAFKGGTLKSFPFDLLLFTNTNGAGAFTLPFALPPGLPTGTELYIQFAIQDTAAISDVALSNAVRGVTP